jgi:hypothetical protein
MSRFTSKGRANPWDSRPYRQTSGRRDHIHGPIQPADQDADDIACICMTIAGVLLSIGIIVWLIP